MKKKGVFNLMKDNELLAVHDDDLAALLKSLNKYDDVIAGNCKCIFCQRQIDMSNLGSIIPIESKVEFSCNEDKCLSELVTLGGEDES